MTPLIETHNLSKTVKQSNQTLEILRDINFKLYPGESVAITGTSGNGKSTLLHLLGTLDTPTSGDLFLLGKKWNSYDLSKLRNQHIGFIFQNFYLLEDDSVINNILIPVVIAKESTSTKSPAYERALYLIESVGLSHRIHARCSTLSGGEKQRVAIARALINNPSILLADEPSGNLDDKTSEHVHNLLLSQVQENRSVLIVTHNKSLARQCHREGILQGGQLLI